MRKTAIEWTDFSANPLKYRRPDGAVVWACAKTSPGCAHCYAEGIALRYERGTTFAPEVMPSLTPFLDEKDLHKILTARTVDGQPVKGGKCFLGDMTDIFGEWVPDDLLDRLFAVIAKRQDVTFQILTKRAKRMLEYMQRRDRVLLPTGCNCLCHDVDGDTNIEGGCERCEDVHVWPLPNVWLGVSVENQKYADERIPLLLQTPAAIRFISAEPLLGPVDIGMSAATCSCCKRWSSRWVQVHREVRPAFPINLMNGADKVVAPAGIHRAESNPHGALSVGKMGLVPTDFTALPKLDWVIVGGESGDGARPFDVAWARSIIKQCADAGVACFVKQLGAVPVNAILGPVNPVNLRAVGAIKNKKGGDTAEWPEDLRVRQFPAVAA